MSDGVAKKEVPKGTLYYQKAVELLEKEGVLIATILLFIVLAIISPSFLTHGNLINIGRQISVTTIMAIGGTFVLISGNLDLSLASVGALTGCVTAGLMQAGVPTYYAISVGLLIGILFGLFNGFLVGKQKIPAFIVTLGTMTVARGLAFLYTGGFPIFIPDEFFRFIGRGFFLGIPMPIYITILMILLGYIVLSRTRFGRYIYAIGGNENAARISGILVDRIKIMTFVFSGLMGSIGGLLLAGRLATGTPQAGYMVELDIYAAVIIGGASLFGGEGNIRGTIIGCLLLGFLTNGMNILNVPPYHQQVVRGLVILYAVWLNTFRMRKKV